MSAQPIGIVPQPAPPEEASSRVERVANLATTVLALLATIFALRVARDLIIPIVLGVLVSYALDPIVAALARLRIPRPVGAALVLAVFVAGSWSSPTTCRTTRRRSR
jgi:predicted PurR-regulated permease PerM